METPSLTILQIDASPRGPLSLSRRLGDLFVDSIVAPDKNVLRRDLGADPPPAIDADWAEAEFVPAAQRDARLKEALALSDVLVDELDAADLVVISAPIYNFSIPASLKAWFDQVVRLWRTFEFGPAGARGLLHGRRAVLILTSGLRYDEGSPFAGKDFAEPLVRAILGFMGIDRLNVVRIEGQMPGAESASDVARAELEIRLLAAALSDEAAARRPLGIEYH